VANLSMGIDPIGNLGFDRLGQQSLGTFSENAAQHILSLGEWQDSCVNATIAHGGVLLCLVGNWVKRTFTPRVRRLFSFDHQQLSVIPQTFWANSSSQSKWSNSALSKPRATVSLGRLSPSCLPIARSRSLNTSFSAPR